MGKILDLTGQRFGKLVAVKYTGKTIPVKGRVWLCKCDCGNYREVLAKQLKNKEVTRCLNCIAERRKEEVKEIQKGVKSKNPLRNVWNHMKRRCYDPNTKFYKYYGGRGIVMCDQWKDSFNSFWEWAISHGYKKGLTIERKDVNGNYCPQNCCFITQREQSYNRRDSLRIIFEGKSIPVGLLVYELDLDYHLFVSFLKKYPANKSTTDLSSKQDLTTNLL